MLNAAYNDAAGVTARFNLNLLTRINRELGGTFDLDSFCHQAFYNTERRRIEMHLASRKRQKVRVAGRSFEFRGGETIHTENSYKYTPEVVRRDGARRGLDAGGVVVRSAGLFHGAGADRKRCVMSGQAAHPPDTHSIEQSSRFHVAPSLISARRGFVSSSQRSS